MPNASPLQDHMRNFLRLEIDNRAYLAIARAWPVRTRLLMLRPVKLVFGQPLLRGAGCKPTIKRLRCQLLYFLDSDFRRHKSFWRLLGDTHSRPGKELGPNNITFVLVEFRVLDAL